MSIIQKLREDRAAKTAECRVIIDQLADTITEDQKSKIDALTADIKAIDEKIDYTEKVLALAAEDLKVTIQDGATSVPGQVIVAHKSVYANLGEQLLDVRSMTLDNADAPKARDRFQKVVNAAAGASTGIDSEGGFLVETDKSKDIITTAIETGVFSSRCTRQPIGANSDSFSYLQADDRDRSTGKRNGLDVFRKSETATMATSGKVGLKERELRVEDMYGLLYVTNRMLRDAVALATYAKRSLTEQFAFKLDLEMFQGNGVGQCLGIMNSDLPVTVAAEAAQTAATIVAANVVKMLARFRGNIGSAAWFINQDVLPSLPFMTVGDQPVFIPGGSFTNAPFGSLFGRPIVPVEFCKTLGTLGDIILADWSQYLLIEKGGTEVAESIHVKFLTDETAYRFITRNNGQPMFDTPITPLNGSNTLSPFVMLAAR
jgi:HK97 family phage major capsid protein